ARSWSGRTSSPPRYQFQGRSPPEPPRAATSSWGPSSWKGSAMSRSNEVEIPEASRAILKANSLGILTTIRHKDGRISSNPVGYVWDGESVRISTLASRMKYANLVANPTVTFCVVDRDDHTRYVELRGHATL